MAKTVARAGAPAAPPRFSINRSSRRPFWRGFRGGFSGREETWEIFIVLERYKEGSESK
ncbi:hypothetical protein Fmac_007869 [Flemingia macrophylla]|uniref:Ribosomal protein L2 n=1 Tax=Flemingia macrophylla TaxID=520843 RepID=A0ABD1MVV3_9FABA